MVRFGCAVMVMVRVQGVRDTEWDKFSSRRSAELAKKKKGMTNH